MDGLVVALDMLTKFCGTKKYRRRLFLITDGEKKTCYEKMELDVIAKTIKNNDVKLNCITLDFCNDLCEDDSDEDDDAKQGPEQDTNMSHKNTGESEAQLHNKQMLLELQKQTGCTIIPAETAIELYKQFKKKEYMARSKFRGNLEISKDLNVGVQIFTKTKEQTLPSLKKYSKNVPENDDENAGKINIERTWTEADDPDQKQIPEN